VQILPNFFFDFVKFYLILKKLSLNFADLTSTSAELI